jgi:hypothetical protein
MRSRTSTDPTYETRAAARRRELVLRKTDLRGAEGDLHPVHGAEAVSLLTRLSLEAWSMSGRSTPAYTRAATEYRFVPRK